MTEKLTRMRPSRAPVGECKYKVGERVAYLNPTGSVRAIDRIEWNRRGWWDLVFITDVEMHAGAKPMRVTSKAWEGLHHVPA